MAYLGNLEICLLLILSRHKNISELFNKAKKIHEVLGTCEFRIHIKDGYFPT